MIFSKEYNSECQIVPTLPTGYGCIESTQERSETIHPLVRSIVTVPYPSLHQRDFLQKAFHCMAILSTLSLSNTGRYGYLSKVRTLPTEVTVCKITRICDPAFLTFLILNAFSYPDCQCMRAVNMR